MDYYDEIEAALQSLERKGFTVRVDVRGGAIAIWLTSPERECSEVNASLDSPTMLLKLLNDFEATQ